jgi:hypothetical protein
LDKEIKEAYVVPVQVLSRAQSWDKEAVAKFEEEDEGCDVLSDPVSDLAVG